MTRCEWSTPVPVAGYAYRLLSGAFVSSVFNRYQLHARL
jgi:hypothetical protein